MILLVHAELDVSQALGPDQVMKDSGSLEVQPPLERLLPGLGLPGAVPGVEDDVTRAPEHELQHGLDLTEADPAWTALTQDRGHGAEHRDAGDDLRQLWPPSGLATGPSEANRVGEVKQLQHGGQGGLAEAELGPGAGLDLAVTLLGDDQPVVVVIVGPGEEEAVQLPACLLDTLGLQELESIDQLQKHEAHVLFKLIDSQTFSSRFEILGKSSELEDM